jgi:hypothetical protein
MTPGIVQRTRVTDRMSPRTLEPRAAAPWATSLQRAAGVRRSLAAVLSGRTANGVRLVNGVRSRSADATRRTAVACLENLAFFISDEFHTAQPGATVCILQASVRQRRHGNAASARAIHVPFAAGGAATALAAAVPAVADARWYVAVRSNQRLVQRTDLRPLPATVRRLRVAGGSGRAEGTLRATQPVAKLLFEEAVGAAAIAAAADRAVQAAGAAELRIADLATRKAGPGVAAVAGATDAAWARGEILAHGRGAGAVDAGRARAHGPWRRTMAGLQALHAAVGGVEVRPVGRTGLPAW